MELRTRTYDNPTVQQVAIRAKEVLDLKKPGTEQSYNDLVISMALSQAGDYKRRAGSGKIRVPVEIVQLTGDKFISAGNIPSQQEMGALLKRSYDTYVTDPDTLLDRGSWDRATYAPKDEEAIDRVLGVARSRCLRTVEKVEDVYLNRLMGFSIKGNRSVLHAMASLAGVLKLADEGKISDQLLRAQKRIAVWEDAGRFDREHTERQWQFYQRDKFHLIQKGERSLAYDAARTLEFYSRDGRSYLEIVKDVLTKKMGTYVKDREMPSETRRILETDKITDEEISAKGLPTSAEVDRLVSNSSKYYLALEDDFLEANEETQCTYSLIDTLPYVLKIVRARNLTSTDELENFYLDRLLGHAIRAKMEGRESILHGIASLAGVLKLINEGRVTNDMLRPKAAEPPKPKADEQAQLKDQPHINRELAVAARKAIDLVGVERIIRLLQSEMNRYRQSGEAGQLKIPHLKKFMEGEVLTADLPTDQELNDLIKRYYQNYMTLPDKRMEGRSLDNTSFGSNALDFVLGNARKNEYKTVEEVRQAILNSVVAASISAKILGKEPLLYGTAYLAGILRLIDTGQLTDRLLNPSSAVAMESLTSAKPLPTVVVREEPKPAIAPRETLVKSIKAPSVEAPAPMVELRSIPEVIHYVRQQIERGAPARFQLSSQGIDGMLRTLLSSPDAKQSLPAEITIKKSSISIASPRAQGVLEITAKKGLSKELTLAFSLRNNPNGREVSFENVNVTPEKVFFINVQNKINEALGGLTMNKILADQLQQELNRTGQRFEIADVNLTFDKNNKLSVQVIGRKRR